jgi:hypothetical protein
MKLPMSVAEKAVPVGLAERFIGTAKCLIG